MKLNTNEEEDTNYGADHTEETNGLYDD